MTTILLLPTLVNRQRRPKSTVLPVVLQMIPSFWSAKLRKLLVVAFFCLQIGGATSWYTGRSSHLLVNACRRRHQGLCRAGSGALSQIISLKSANNEQEESNRSLEEIKRKLDYQQQQIEQLLRLFSEQQKLAATASPVGGTTPVKKNQTAPPTGQLTPIKAMLFIDGTWLYYSIYERRYDECPIQQTIGLEWTRTHFVDWPALIRVISRHLAEQHNVHLNAENNRTVEVVRASVFTSYKADTPHHSYRYKMFEELRQANFDVYMMETIGRGEKCVDIQLAVEMLHFATVPHAYDVAVLLTGDKDFMPAMIRTRQKGKKVALVSMKRGCNQALDKTDLLKDFDTIWLDNHLDEIIVPLDKVSNRTEQPVSQYTILKVLSEFIEASGQDEVSSRVVGRYLKIIEVGKHSLLDVVKKFYGGLSTFLVARGSDIFTVEWPHGNRTYMIGLKPDARKFLLGERRRASLNAADEEFLGVNHNALSQDNSMPRATTLEYQSKSPSESNGQPHDKRLPNLTHDYSKYKLAQLKDVCRSMNLPVSGVKSVLLERIQRALKNEGLSMPAQQTETQGISAGAESTLAEQGPSLYLKELVEEYLHASGGIASSRELGRYLSANRSSTGTLQSAGHELKILYKSLAFFLQLFPDVFERCNDNSDEKNAYSFAIKLRGGTGKKPVKLR